MLDSLFNELDKLDKLIEHNYKEGENRKNAILFLLTLLYSAGMIILSIFLGLSDYTKGNDSETFVRSESVLKLAVVAGGIAILWYLIQRRYYNAFLLFVGLLPVNLFSWFILA